MTADLGLGANIAIESAIVLSNILHREVSHSHNPHPSASHLSTLFTEYQNARFDRASAFVAISGKATRMHSYHTFFSRLYAGYIGPYLAPVQTLKFAESSGKAPKLDYVPVRNVDESAPGWKLGEKKSEGMGWWAYALVCSTVGAAVAWGVTMGFPALL
jgi:FAD dependent monooxygenase